MPSRPQPSPVRSHKAFDYHQDGQDNDDAKSLSSASTSSESSSSSVAEPPGLDEQFLPRILALFFTIFHPAEGPKVVYQVPEGSVTSDEVGDKRAKGRRASSTKSKYRRKPDEEDGEETSWSPLLQHEPLFDFDTLSDYLIPKASLCGRLITCTARGSAAEDRSSERRSANTVGNGNGNVNGKGRSGSRRHRSPYRSGKEAALGQERVYKVVSHPILLQDSTKYDRNTFIFNLAFVFDGKADVKSYEPVIRKCARMLQGLEESSSFLSSQKSQPRMYGVVEQLFQGLNTYCEAFVPLPEGHQVNYDGRSRHRTAGSLSQALGHPHSWSHSKSLSRGSSAKRKVEAARGLSAAVEKSFDRYPPDDRRSSDTVGPVIPGDALAMTSTIGRTATERSSEITKAPQTEASLQISPISPSSEPAEESRLSSPPPLEIPASTLPPPSSLGMEKDLLPSQRPSTSITAGLIRSPFGSEATTPQVPKTMVMSTVAVNETSATAITSRKASGGAKAVNDVSSLSLLQPNGPPDQAPQNANPPEDGLLPRSQASDHAAVADLSSSLASLRVIREPVAGQPTDENLVDSLVKTPSALRSGQREAPHGLGRTVKESINIKLFPTWPNPPPVNEWDVPVSLLDLGRRAAGDSSSWDLTMARVYPHINGINHVKRISQLADADLELTRQCMEHLLYYGCIVMVDIFQFFNIYTVRPAIAAMADYPAIQAECGPYVTRPGYVPPAWPTLLSLYTALRPGIVLDAWIEDRDVEVLGVDVRRFVTFGIIKGFLKRVHRYPYLIGGSDTLTEAMKATLGEYPETAGIMLRESSLHLRSSYEQRQGRSREPSDRQPGGSRGQNSGNFTLNSATPASQSTLRVTHQGSAILSTPERPPSSSRQASDVASIRTVTARTMEHDVAPEREHLHPVVASRQNGDTMRYPLTTVADAANTAYEDTDKTKPFTSTTRPSKSTLLSSAGDNSAAGSGGDGVEDSKTRSGPWGSALTVAPSAHLYPGTPTAPRGGRKPPNFSSTSAHATVTSTAAGSGSVAACLMTMHPELPEYLDGTHCEDEICVRFGLSWPQLRRILIQIGRASSSWSSGLGVTGVAEGLGGLRPTAAAMPPPSSSSSNLAGRRPSTQQEDWPMETPAFGNPSGFAGQSGFGASAWQTSHLGATSNIAVAGGIGQKARRPSVPSGLSGGGAGGGFEASAALGAGRRSSVGPASGLGLGANARVASQSNARSSIYRTSAEIGSGGLSSSSVGTPGGPGTGGGAASGGPSTSGPALTNWLQQLDHLEIDSDEEQMERSGELGGAVVLLTV